MNPTADDDSAFDGQFEISRRLERHASYGLTKSVYGSIAQASMGALKYAGISPCSIEKLPDRPGALVTLYGVNLAYYLTVAADVTPNRVTLGVLSLDTNEPSPVEVISGADSFGLWSRVVNTMLKLEGLRPCWRAMSYEEASEYLRSQGL